MLKRLWFVITLSWTGVFLFNGFSKQGGISSLDLAIAFAPFVVARILQFIVLGSRVR